MRTGIAAFVLAGLITPQLGAQQPVRPDSSRAPRQQVVMDSARAALLYVSNRAEDAPVADYAREIAAKRRTDSIYAARSAGVMEFRKITYQSSADGLTIPAYLFAPLTKRGARGHAAMVWVHGGVHGDWGTTMFPFVREAVQRGYVIITPDYRGSTGYGEKHRNLVDYGGKELDDFTWARWRRCCRRCSTGSCGDWQ